MTCCVLRVKTQEPEGLGGWHGAWAPALLAALREDMRAGAMTGPARNMTPRALRFGLHATTTNFAELRLKLPGAISKEGL